MVVLDLAYLWPFLNFLLLVAVAVYYGREPVARFIRSYEEDVDESLDQAEQNRREAGQRLEDWRRRWSNIDGEVREMLRRSEEAGGRSLDQALERARAEEEHLRSRVADTMERDRDRALAELREEMADVLVTSVSDSMATLVTAGDHRHMSRHFITEIGDAP